MAALVRTNSSAMVRASSAMHANPSFRNAFSTALSGDLAQQLDAAGMRHGVGGISPKVQTPNSNSSGGTPKAANAMAPPAGLQKSFSMFGKGVASGAARSAALAGHVKAAAAGAKVNNGTTAVTVQSSTRFVFTSDDSRSRYPDASHSHMPSPLARQTSTGGYSNGPTPTPAVGDGSNSNSANKSPFLATVLSGPLFNALSTSKLMDPNAHPIATSGLGKRQRSY